MRFITGHKRDGLVKSSHTGENRCPAFSSFAEMTGFRLEFTSALDTGRMTIIDFSDFLRPNQTFNPLFLFLYTLRISSIFPESDRDPFLPLLFGNCPGSRDSAPIFCNRQTGSLPFLLTESYGNLISFNFDLSLDAAYGALDGILLCHRQKVRMADRTSSRLISRPLHFLLKLAMA